MALRLKNSGLDGEAIYARLEKQGVPKDLARQIAYDVLIEREREVKLQHKPDFNFALIQICAGIVIAVISYFTVKSAIIFAIIFIVRGIISVASARK